SASGANDTSLVPAFPTLTQARGQVLVHTVVPRSHPGGKATMRTSTLLTLLAVTLPALGGCQSLPASEDLLASLEAAERARFEAWVSGDVERIRPFLAEELVYCHTNGICQTRDELLEAMGAGATV